MDTPALEITGLVKRFRGRAVLDGLTLRVERGEVLVLLGENGVGKSTLMRCVLGLHRPEAGRIEVAGLDPIRDATRVRRRVGYVPDKPDAYPWMTVPELFRFLRAHQPSWSDARANGLAEALRVPLDVPMRDLSRGQGMKAMLAAAVAPDPEVLLLDEPFAGLDPLVREEVLKGVLRELCDGQRTIVCATHELDAAARIADRVAVLANGRVARLGTVAEVVGAPDEPADAPARLHETLAAVAMAGIEGEGS